jgi:hypothetical protein
MNNNVNSGIARKIIMHPGPVLSLTLIGMLLLSALLYYRAVKIQRFMEPALALSQPRIQFNQDINALLEKEFGSAFRGIAFSRGSIFVDQSLLFNSSRKPEDSERVVFKKLANVFLSALSDPDIRSRISLILVSNSIPLTTNPRINQMLRYQAQERIGFILNALYDAEPTLETKFGMFFSVTTMHKPVPIKEADMVEFQMIPTERLHIDVLERLEKYTR